MILFRRQMLAGAPVLGAAVLAGCASPPARYYRLAVIPGATHALSPVTIRVRSITIPDDLDQNGIAQFSTDYRFATFPNDLWADPLAAMLQSEMEQDLSQRLPGAEVIDDGGAVGAPALIRVEMNLLRFDPDPTGAVILSGQVAIRSGENGGLWDSSGLQASTVPSGVAALDIVATMSMMWATVADRIAVMIAGRCGEPS